jgi:large subunit ribosomal protein L24
MSGRAKLMNILLREKRSKLKPSQRDKPRRWNIVRGDTVEVVQRNHPEYKKQGTVSAVLRDKNRVIVENLNLGPKRIKGDPDKGIKGQTIMVERSMHYSNVNLVDPVTGFPTRITYSFLEDGTKVRISKRSGAIIPKPDILKEKRVRSLIASEDSDTMNEDDVWGTTYDKKVSKWEDMRNELLKTMDEKGLGGGQSSSRV